MENKGTNIIADLIRFIFAIAVLILLGGSLLGLIIFGWAITIQSWPQVVHIWNTIIG